MKTTTLTLVDGVSVVVPDSLALMTPYVLREQGDWFEDDIRFVRSLLQPGDAVIDIGANHGVYTLSMAHAVGPSGRVWAYEPASGVRGLLQQSVAANGFEARIKVEGKALSNRRGEALLSINIQPELNTLNGYAASGEQESVPLTSLDDELAAQGWADIGFMKMDAEGEEGRILEGGTGFFAALSPLVLFEIKAGVKAQLGLVDDFGRLGYGCYRLVPGLGLLVPFAPGSSVDDYLLNLYACKPDRARRLVERGCLCDVLHALADEPASWGGQPPAGEWRRVLEARPYAAPLRDAWRQNETVDARVDEALSLHVRAHESERTPAVRLASLRRCQALMRSAERDRSSSVRRATLARVQVELGERAPAVSAVAALANEIARTGHVDLSEPFLPPLQRFDALPAGTVPTNWFLASVLEAYEAWGSFSSFFTGASSLQSLQSIAALGYAGPEMTRRLALVQQRQGVSTGTAAPVPLPVPTARPARPEVARKMALSAAAGAALQSAQGRLAVGQVAVAEEALTPWLDDPAARPEALYLLAVAAVMAGRADVAISRAQDAVAAAPADPRCQLVLGRAYKLGVRLPQAVAAYRSALELDPDYVEAHVSLGVALKHGGDLHGALQSYERAVALKPDMAAARANLAYTRAALAEQALEVGADTTPDPALVEESRQATLLDPGNAQLHFNLGLLLRRARRRDEAIDAFNRALGAAPARDDICLNLGHELIAGGLGGNAVQLYERWLQTQPPAPAVMRALANQLTREGRAGDALTWAERVAALEPEPRAWLQLCHSYQQCRRLPEALAAGRKAIELSGRRWPMYSVPLMVANYLVEDAAELAALHAEAGAALAAELPLQMPPQVAPASAPACASSPSKAPAPGRLRVAYVSADFISHSVAFFMAPLLQHHDRAQFEVWCYHNRGWADDTTAHLRACADRWVECEHLSDEALARRIHADGIDILVDLSGHTSGARLGVFARGAAPLQVSYLGYPTVTGVQGMHHRITDHVIDPGDQPDIGSERPLVLARSMFCYRPPSTAEAPDVAPEPPSRRGAVTFGSFNNVAKLSDRTLALWARVLHAVPGSRLLLKAAAAGDAATQRSILDFMAAQGVPATRLEMRARIGDRREHLALYGDVDVALDSHPYNGATTTCEALWMGVPVVTLAGRTHPSRMGASILAAAGQGGWVCHDDDRFVALAAALAADEAGRADWRRLARTRLQRSELMDEPGFVDDFELLLLRAWQARAGRLGRSGAPMQRGVVRNHYVPALERRNDVTHEP